MDVDLHRVGRDSPSRLITDVKAKTESISSSGMWTVSTRRPDQPSRRPPDLYINGDKRDDRILITANGGARAWINEGPGGSGGTYRDIGKISNDGAVPPKDVQFADVNGDGKAVRIGWTGVAHAWLNKMPAGYFDTFHP